MQLPTEVFGQVAVVHTPAELNEDNADQFENYVRSLEQATVVVDLDGTESIDSQGLASLLNGQEFLRELGGDLKISSDSVMNRKILEITRLDQQLDVFDSVIDAVKSYG